MSERLRWNGARNARLGYLVCLGWTPEQIARDDFIRSTPAAVRRQAQRMDLVFRNRGADAIPPSVMDAFEREGRRYEFSGNQLLVKAVRILALQPSLLHSVCEAGGIKRAAL